MDQGLDSRLKNPQYNAAQAKLHIDNRMKILKALHAGGVGVLLGSDARSSSTCPVSIHREMQRMADAGISATRSSSRARPTSVSISRPRMLRDHRGRATRRSDPGRRQSSAERGNMEKRSGVMVRGRWLPASEIDARLAKIAASK